MTVNQRVRYLRKEILGLTQAEFGEALHLRQSAIAMMETQTGVTGRNIAAICEQWGVREEWLTDGSGPVFRQGALRPNGARAFDTHRKKIYDFYASLDDGRQALFWRLYEQVAK